MKLFRASVNVSSPLLQKLQSRVWVCARLAADPPPLLPGWSDSLFNRLVLAGDPRASVVPVLDKWVKEGRPVEKMYLQWMVKQMRAFRRYGHALQISIWMSDQRYFPLSPGDLADRVDLITKVHGIEHAESYFTNISRKLKVRQPYGALLHCYAEAKSVEKAEILFKEMEELKFLTSFHYNVLIKLYSLTGHHDKVGIVFHEMEEKGIPPDNFTFNILMDAYCLASDIHGIEDLLRRINPHRLGEHWRIYASAAKGYTKAGLIHEALAMLKKSEELIPQKKGRVAYGFLLTVYADVGIKHELYRLWHKFKLSEKTTNSIYICMLSCLLKLDDLEGAESILKEWESQCSFYDFRVPNVLISAYCKKGVIDKAEALVTRAIENGRTPFANTWDHLAGAYFTSNQIPKAIETMKKALVAAKDTMWRPSSEKVTASLEHLSLHMDVEAVEEFTSLLQDLGPLSQELYHFLLRTYGMAGKSTTSVLNRMKEDGLDADEETHKTLGSGD